MQNLPKGNLEERIKAEYKGGEYREDKDLEQIHQNIIDKVSSKFDAKIRS